MCSEKWFLYKSILLYPKLEFNKGVSKKPASKKSFNALFLKKNFNYTFWYGLGSKRVTPIYFELKS